MTRSAISALFGSSALLLLPLGLAGCATTATYGTGEMPEVAMFREVTGGLLNKNNKKTPIEYQPRAPLVMPAAADALPPPVDSAAAVSTDWPVDREDRIASNDPRATDDDPGNDINQAEYHRLKPLVGAFPTRSTSSSDEPGGRNEYYENIVHGREKREAFSKAVADAEGFNRDERRFLTDPPVSYREPDPTAPMDTSAADADKGNFLSRWWRRR